MKKRVSFKLVVIYFTLFLYVSSKSYGSFENATIGARYCGMGRTSVGFVDTPEAIYLNPAGLALRNDLSLSGYIVHPYGVKEIVIAAAMMKIPVSHFMIGCGIKTYGNRQYHEKHISLSIANCFGKHLRAGMTMHIMKLTIERYGADSAIGCDIGLMLNIRSNISYGFYAGNLGRSCIGGRKESIPQVLVTGLHYQPDDDSSINVDIFKDVLYPIELRLGFEYFPISCAGFRAGFQTSLKIFSAGFGFKFHHIDIDYGIETHPYLNASHQFSIKIKLK